MIFYIYLKLTIKRIVSNFIKHVRKFANESFQATYSQIVNYVCCAISYILMIEFSKKKIYLMKLNNVLKNVLSHRSFLILNNFLLHLIFQMFIVN